MNRETRARNSLHARIGAVSLAAIAILACAPCLAYTFALPEAAFADEGTTRVLFVGNSMTRHNGMSVAEMFADIAEANGKSVEVKCLAKNGAALSDYAFPDEETLAWRTRLDDLLKSKAWDYVVFQDKVKNGVSAPATATYTSIRALSQLVSRYQPDAEVLLYAPHGFCDGTETTLNGQSVVLSDSDLQLFQQATYTRIGARLGLRVVPVGMYFHKHDVLYPDEPLLSDDARHPGPMGYFLAGCAFYDTIFSEAPAEPAASVISVSDYDQSRLFSLFDGSVTMEPSSAALGLGGKAHLDFATDDPFLVYGSADPSIASVGTDGMVTGNAEGTTVAYVESSSGLRATCAVSVESSRLQEAKLLFPASSITKAEGKSAAMDLLVSDTLGDFELSWSSSDESVASVSPIGIVTAVGPGKAKVSVRDVISGYTATCTVIVPLAKPQGIDVAKVTRKKGTRSSAGFYVTWDKVDRAKNYTVYRKVGSSNYKKVASVKKPKYTDWSVSANKLTRYYVVAKMGASACSSKRSGLADSILLSSPIASAEGKATGVKLSWGVNRAADGYEVFRARANSSDFERIKVIRDDGRSAYIDKSAKPGKRYRYKVRSFRDWNDERFHSAFSPVRSAKVAYQSRPKLQAGIPR